MNDPQITNGSVTAPTNQEYYRAVGIDMADVDLVAAARENFLSLTMSELNRLFALARIGAFVKRGDQETIERFLEWEKRTTMGTLGKTAEQIKAEKP